MREPFVSKFPVYRRDTATERIKSLVERKLVEQIFETRMVKNPPDMVQQALTIS